MLQNFYIDLLICDWIDGAVKYSPARLTSFTNGVGNTFGTFDEKLTIKSNSIQELTFSMYHSQNQHINPFWPLIVNDRKLSLTLEGSDDYYMEFYIVDITPTIGTNNIKYTVKCQDAFSYDFSKQNINLSFSTKDEDIWNLETGPQSIVALVQKLLDVCHIKTWILNPDINTYKMSFADNLYSSNDFLRVSMETTSTPYGILVEIAKLFNATISIDYKNKIIDFISDDLYQSKVYDLRPDYNLTSFSYSEKGDQLFNILHVRGGEDAYGNYISLMPPMPLSVRDYFITKMNSGNSEWKTTSSNRLFVDFLNNNNTNAYLDADESRKFFLALERIKSCSTFLYDFSYWKDRNLISQPLLDGLEKSFQDYRNINLQYLCYSSLYYELLNKYESMRATEDGIIRSIASEEEFLAYNEEPEKAEERLTYYQKSTLVEYLGKKYFKIYSNDVPDMYNKYTDLGYGMLDGADSKYFLPDFVGFTNQKVLLYVKGLVPSEDKYYEVGIDYNYSVNQFSLDVSSTGLDINKADQTIKTHFAVLHEIDNQFWQSYSKQIMDIDYITQAKITDLAQDLFALWNDNYVRIALDLYGKNVFTQKIEELNGEFSVSYGKYNLLLLKLLKCIEVAGVTDEFGAPILTEEAALSETVRNKMISTSENFSVYADLIEERNKLTTAIGGIGTRIDGNKNRTFRGYYTTYIDYIKLLTDRKKDMIEAYELPLDYPNGLFEKIQELQNKQKRWKENFYSTYMGLIRESEFTDADQLDAESLYATASRQFYSYKEPGQSYSSSYFSNDDLMQPLDDININDVVRINQLKLFNKNSKQVFMVSLRKYMSPFNLNGLHNRIINLAYVDKEGKTNNCNGIIQNVEQDDIYYLITVKFVEELDNLTNCSLSIDGQQLYIDSILPVPISDPVKLKITGITKTLRSSKIDLTVERKNIVNFIIDRILYNFK